MKSDTDNKTASAQPPKYWRQLLNAAREVEASSHIDLEANEYHVDVYAMAMLCAAISNRRFKGVNYP